MLTAEALLAGPRGRRLCWTLLWIGGDDAGRTDAWGQVWRAVVVAGDLSGWVDELSVCVTRAGPAALAARPDGPEEPLGAWSGQWWSDPAMSGLPVTTRARSGLGAARLALDEDSFGWTSARCWPLAPRDGARVYEVDGPAAWSSLVTRYPLDVSRSRRHNWWRATGWTRQWLIPDFEAVARDYDAVHVSVLGYLMTAGVAVPAGPDNGARTLLAGWDPDATWWLTDSLAPAGPPEDWEADDATAWHPAG